MCSFLLSYIKPMIPLKCYQENPHHPGRRRVEICKVLIVLHGFFFVSNAYNLISFLGWDRDEVGVEFLNSREAGISDSCIYSFCR